MTHQICDACECVSHCRKNGCIPVTPIPANCTLPVVDGQGACERVTAFLDLYAKRRGLHPEEIHSLGTSGNALLLTTSDLRALCAFAEASCKTEKPALPLSTSVTSLQLELSAALEMAVRDRMLVKELAAALEPFTMFRLEDIASLGENERYTITMLGFHMQQAVAALSKVPP